MLLSTRELSAGYVPEVDILKGVDIDVNAGELVTVVGPNGAGKSTLVKTIMNLAPYRSGSVLLHGEEISRYPAHKIVRRGVGYVPQRANVFASMTVSENLDLGVIPFKNIDISRRRSAICELFPVLAERQHQRAGTLSGGERQMLAMARVLMAEPALVLLDEPSAGLSPALVDAVLEQIAEINSRGVAVLLVEQNARRALAVSHRGYVLDLGRNAYAGRGMDLLNDSRVAELYLGGARSEQRPKELSG